jgi:hypothetical protein
MVGAAVRLRPRLGFFHKSARQTQNDNRMTARQLRPILTFHTLAQTWSFHCQGSGVLAHCPFGSKKGNSDRLPNPPNFTSLSHP